MKRIKPDQLDSTLNRRAFLRLAATSMALPLFPANAADTTSAAVVRKPIPSSGEQIPVIGIGTSRVFEVGESAAARQGPLQALAALQQLGNAMIDTSPMYGEAEQVIGELLPQLPKPPGFFLATKVWTSGRQAGIDQMNNSFRLLGASQVDLMQIHNLVDWRTHLETLRVWKDEQRIRYIGLTHYRDDAHDELARLVKAIPELDFIQINYSLLEPAAARNLLPLCRDRGVAVIANRPFGRANWFSRTRGKTLPAWAAEFGISSWAQFALKWIVSDPAITCAIPGTSKAKHMLDNIQGGSGTLPDQATRQRMAMLAREL